jgi:hypothetical protein
MFKTGGPARANLGALTELYRNCTVAEAVEDCNKKFVIVTVNVNEEGLYVKYKFLFSNVFTEEISWKYEFK